MKEIIILFIFYFLTLQAYTQDRYTIAGTVLNEDKEPIAYAAVYILNQHKGIPCDERGVFHFRFCRQKNAKYKSVLWGIEPESGI